MRISATEQGLIELGRSSATDIHLLIDFGHDLDASAIETAWGAVVARHPVLSMRVLDGRWVEGGNPPRFAPAPLVEADRVPGLQDRAVLRLGPMEEGYRLSLSVDHVAVDGRGLLNLGEELRVAHARVADGGVPDVDVDATTRSLDVALHDSIPTADRLRLVADGTARWAGLGPSTHVDPARFAPGAPRRHFAVVDIDEAFAVISRIHRETALPTDGVLVGLLTVAWTRVFGHEPGGSGWLLATDLRPYLGIDGGLGNLSGTEPVLVSSGAVGSPREAVSAASDAVTAVREGWPGAGPELLAGMYRWVPAAVTGQAARLSFDAVAGRGFTRVVTNLGPAPSGLHRWAGGDARRISFVPPLASPPYVALGLLTAGGSTRLSARVGDDWFTRSHLQALAEHLDMLAAEY